MPSGLEVSPNELEVAIVILLAALALSWGFGSRNVGVEGTN